MEFKNLLELGVVDFDRNFHDENLVFSLTPCLFCVNLNLNDFNICKAFPDDIPISIIGAGGNVPHFESQSEQNNTIVFELDPELQALRKYFWAKMFWKYQDLLTIEEVIEEFNSGFYRNSIFKIPEELKSEE